MKIRQPWLIKSLCMLGFWLYRALMASVFCKYWRSGRDFRPSILDPQERFIYVLWHEYMLVPLVHFSHSSVRMLLSQHADGLIVEEICKHLRMGLVRGSSTRGGVEAMRRLLKPGRYRCLAITPDGPRGPRRQIQLGVIYLAARLGWPIIAVGIGYDHPWRLKSWDRLAIPKPYSRACVVTAEPLSIPGDLDREGLEGYRRRLEDQMNALTAQAELAACSGKRPVGVPATVPDTLAAIAA